LPPLTSPIDPADEWHFEVGPKEPDASPVPGLATNYLGLYGAGHIESIMELGNDNFVDIDRSLLQYEIPPLKEEFGNRIICQFILMRRVPIIESFFAGKLFLDMKCDAPSKDNRSLKVRFKCFALSDLRLLGLLGKEFSFPKRPPCNALFCHRLLQD